MSATALRLDPALPPNRGRRHPFCRPEAAPLAEAAHKVKAPANAAADAACVRRRLCNLQDGGGKL